MRNLLLFIFILISLTSAFSQNGSSLSKKDGNLSNSFITAQISEPYPVPSSSFISFDYKNIKEGIVEIYSMSGSRVKRIELKAQSGKVVLSARDFSKGVYIYKISDFSSGLIKDGKIVFN